jgi:translation initiation factor IF-2
VGRGAARRPGHSAYAPLAHVLADPSPSPAGRPPAPARPLLGPPPSTVRWASGGRPPGPRLPGASAPGHPRRTRCALSGRADADGPRATTARGRPWRRPWAPPPGRPPGALGPGTRLPPPPGCRLPHRQERWDRPLAAGPPDLGVPRDGADRRRGARGPPRPPRSLRPGPPRPGHPGGRPGRVQRPRPPRPGPLWRGGTGAHRRCRRARHAPRRRSLLGAETRARSRQTWPCARA